MPAISKLCDLQTKYTNHTVWATAVPEKVIADCTGHRSTKVAVRAHLAEQLQAAGLAVTNESPYSPGNVKKWKPLALLNQDPAAQLKHDPAAAVTVWSMESHPTFPGIQNCIINVNQ